MTQKVTTHTWCRVIYSMFALPFCCTGLKDLNLLYSNQLYHSKSSKWGFSKCYFFLQTKNKLELGEVCTNKENQSNWPIEHDERQVKMWERSSKMLSKVHNLLQSQNMAVSISSYNTHHIILIQANPFQKQISDGCAAFKYIFEQGHFNMLLPNSCLFKSHSECRNITHVEE